jgi:hypothetical protein
MPCGQVEITAGMFLEIFLSEVNFLSLCPFSLTVAATAVAAVICRKFLRVAIVFILI